MNELDFIVKEDKTGPGNIDPSTAIYEHDITAYLIYSRHNDSYQHVIDHFKKVAIDEIELFFIIYRLRMRNNKTRAVFHTALAYDNPYKAKRWEDSTKVEQYIHYGACLMMHQPEDVKEAYKFLEEAIRLDDKALLAYANLGALAVRENNKEKALELFNKALNINPNHAQVLANKLELLLEMPETSFNDFKITVQALLSNDPLHPSGLHYAIQIALRDRSPYTALSYLKVYCNNYYLENGAVLLLLQVLFALPAAEARATFNDIQKAAPGPIATDILQKFYNQFMHENSEWF
jgi:tetratricopeptide (TPR) repeat protein